MFEKTSKNKKNLNFWTARKRSIRNCTSCVYHEFKQTMTENFATIMLWLSESHENDTFMGIPKRETDTTNGLVVIIFVFAFVFAF